MAHSNIQSEIKLTDLSAKLYFQTAANRSVHAKDLSQAIETTLQKASNMINEQNCKIQQLNQIIRSQRQQIAEMKKSEFKDSRSPQKSSLSVATIPPKSSPQTLHKLSSAVATTPQKPSLQSPQKSSSAAATTPQKSSPKSSHNSASPLAITPQKSSPESPQKSLSANVETSTPKNTPPSTPTTAYEINSDDDELLNSSLELFESHTPNKKMKSDE